MAEEVSYRLARGGQHYGPYTLDQLREYVRQGSVQASELVWCPGMPNWVPLGDVLGSGAAPAGPPPPPPPLSTMPPSDGTRVAPVAGAGPRPPSLHWAIVLLLTLVTFGIFGVIWAILQARWVRRIDLTNRAFLVIVGGLALQLVLAIAAEDSASALLDFLASIVGLVTWVTAYFSMRSSIEWRYGLSLSGVMTFFFNVLYLQYHLSRIARGEVTPRVQAS